MTDDGSPNQKPRDTLSSVHDAVNAIRAESWRDHALRSAERSVADQWLRHLRERLRAGFTEWADARRERDIVRRLLAEAENVDDQIRVATLRPMVERVTTAEASAYQHYRAVADAVITETCRVNEAVIEMNRDHLAQLGEAQAAMHSAIDKALDVKRSRQERPT
ncbi:hypothetical protein J4573_45455 [Actinomadura barringtoniae]|uniref:Uncharacterized protein n=1 Tax=Actinomadura barringtoniae TaxID=1427535 RepID=A0A939TCB9_9ACTN|nr:hypothetical protein [Actinomadura barringtoniae]MBO2454402.1 hypothetical protein [Actinomadura barringtoniae]